MSGETLTAVEGIKSRSNFLRGTIAESLLDAATGALAEDDTQLSKFHGFYQQDDRDQRSERARRKLEPLHSFMIRVRVPGGMATAKQWLVMDDLARTQANGTLRLTTRQAFQFHGVIKRRLKPTIRAINDTLLDTIAACGDVNRNVMCTPLAEKSAIHEAAYAAAAAISEHLTPRTQAYHEIWLDKKKIADSSDQEPIYGATYLPRKFKIGVAIPPANDIDIFSQDLGFIAIEKSGVLEGFNVTAGGGMGMTHGEPETYPRVADVVGFCTVEQATAVAEQVVKLQRDFGDRSNRKHARLKYAIADRGLPWFRQELQSRLGFQLEDAKPYRFLYRGDAFGWTRDPEDRWHLSLFIPEGRVQDLGGVRMLGALREVALLLSSQPATFRLTANQNLIISDLTAAQKQVISRLLEYYGVTASQTISPLRAEALACVALPTCALAMAEAERYLPELTSKIEALLTTHALDQEAISLRITGCPNGCARPYLAEIALVGKAPGRYALYLGGNADGSRLNELALENADEPAILKHVDGWLARFKGERQDGEAFGDFVHSRQAALRGVA